MSKRVIVRTLFGAIVALSTLGIDCPRKIRIAGEESRMVPTDCGDIQFKLSTFDPNWSVECDLRPSLEFVLHLDSVHISFKGRSLKYSAFLYSNGEVEDVSGRAEVTGPQKLFLNFQLDEWADGMGWTESDTLRVNFRNVIECQGALLSDSSFVLVVGSSPWKR